MKCLSVLILLQLVCLGWIRATTGSSLKSTVGERSETENLAADLRNASNWVVRKRRRHIGPLEGQIRGNLGWKSIQNKELKSSQTKTPSQRHIIEEQRERNRNRKREKVCNDE